MTIQATRAPKRQPVPPRPYAGETLAAPDPAPEDIAWKRYDRMRMLAPALLASLVTGIDIPAPEVPPLDLPPIPANASRKERHRLREQRRRLINQDKARRAAVVEAARIEIELSRQDRLDERFAPAVLRHSIMANGRMIVGPRIEIVGDRPVRVSAVGVDSDPLAKMARDSKQITDRHIRAATILRADWNEVGSGLNVGAVDYLRSGGGSGTDQPILGRDGPMLAQIEARCRLDGAMTFLGAFAPAVARVVLDCIPLSVWAAEVAKQPGEAVTWIGCALDRLALFYSPPRPENNHAVGILTIGPPRSSYEV